MRSQECFDHGATELGVSLISGSNDRGPARGLGHFCTSVRDEDFLCLECPGLLVKPGLQRCADATSASSLGAPACLSSRVCNDVGMPRRYDLPNHAHELTFSTYRRQPVLMHEGVALIVLEAIRRAGERHNIAMLAFIIMPEHVHVLVRPMGQKPTAMKTYVAAIKRPASFRVHQLLAQTAPQLDQSLVDPAFGFRLWLPGGGYDRNLASRDAVRVSIEYIHNNPVRRGLCSAAGDWPWSSCKQWHEPGCSLEPFMPKVVREAVR